MSKYFYLILVSIVLLSCSNSENETGSNNSSNVLSVRTHSIDLISLNNAQCFTSVTVGQNSLEEVGVCWSTSQNPTVAGPHAVGTLNQVTQFYSTNLGPLNMNTTYYIRSYAKDNTGVVYSSQSSFKTLNKVYNLGGGVTDIDGNNYGSVVLNNQEWMAKNLNVSKYRNGDIIPQVTDINQWNNLTTGAWCYYRNDTSNGTVYGKLYNWYAINDPRGLAPQGWHIPSDAEWTDLVNFLGGENAAGPKIKEFVALPWETSFANNQSGFNAIPSGTGYLNYNNVIVNPTLDDVFKNNPKVCYWWSSTVNGDLAFSRNVSSIGNTITRSGLLKKSAISVRCIKN